jgi:hypothetical protein
MKEIREYLTKIGLPKGDLYELPTSDKKFPDGAHFRIEVPTVNTYEAMVGLLDRAKELGLTINKIDETYGIMRHTDEEIINMVELAKKNKIELVMSPGPRAKYDTSATAQTPMGSWIGYRLRGTEQLIRAVEDIRRAISLGVRAFLVYDEGFLWLVGKMRNDGLIPSDVKFKFSAHCGQGNPASAKLMESLGADSFNPCRDLELPMIAAIRSAINIPLDVHVDNPPASGGFIRTYEAPELVRIGAPIHLKCGNSVMPAHGTLPSEKDGRKMAEQAWLAFQMVKKYYPEAVQSKPGAKGIAVPR